MQLFTKEYGLTGYGLYVKLLQDVYKNGYYLIFSPDVARLYALTFGIEINLQYEIVDRLTDVVFCKDIYLNYGVLTSADIQRKYLFASSRRKGITLDSRYSLVDADSNADNFLPRDGGFTPPTLEEVAAYCRDNNYTVDPVRFYEYYSANCWMAGRVPVKDWQQKVKEWQGRERGGIRTKCTGFVNYNQPSYTDSEVEEILKRKKEKERKERSM